MKTVTRLICASVIGTLSLFGQLPLPGSGSGGGGGGGGTGDMLTTNNLSDLANKATSRTNLGVAIGTNVQAYDATLLSIAGLGTAADKIAYTTGVDTWAETPLTAAARSILDDTTVAAIRTTLGSTTVGDAVYIAASTAAARIAIGAIIGVDVQAFHANLTALAGISFTQGDIPYVSGSTTMAVLSKNTSATRYLSNQGTSNNPSWSQVDLTNGVTGLLPAANAGLSILDGSANYAADAGSNDTYVITLSPCPSSYVTGGHYRFKANTANTGAATINICSLGAKTIVKVVGGITTTLADNDIRVGQFVDLVYDGTNMQMQSTLGNGPASGVTSVICGTGLTGGTITSTGTCAFDPTASFTWTGTNDFTGSAVALNTVFQRTDVSDTTTAGQIKNFSPSSTVAGARIVPGSFASMGVTAGYMAVDTAGNFATADGVSINPVITAACALSGSACVAPSAGLATFGGSTFKVTSTAMGTGVLAFLTTPSSANLRAAITDESGTGAALFANGALGAATATSINKMAITAPATSSTLAVADGKTFTVNNTLTITATDGITMTTPTTSFTAARTDAANTFTGVQTFSTPIAFASMAQPFVTNAKTATYQVLAADFTGCKTIPVASGTFTITLVASGSQPADGQCIRVLNYGSGVVTVARSGQNINGAAVDQTLAAGSASVPTGILVTSDGTNYFAQPSSGGSSGANTTLSNLGTTSLNADILASSDGGRSIGASGGTRFLMYPYALDLGSASTPAGGTARFFTSTGAVYFQSGHQQFGSAVGLEWSSGDPYSTGTDVGLRRRGVNILEADNGTALIGTTPGNAATFFSGKHFIAEQTADPSAANLSIAGSNAQDVAAIYTKNDKLVIAYNRSGTVTYLTIPLDAATATWTQGTTAP